MPHVTYTQETNNLSGYEQKGFQLYTSNKTDNTPFIYYF